MEKIKRSDRDKILKLIINKELYHHNITIDDIKDVKNWFSIYKFDNESTYQEWKDFCMDLMINKISPKFTKKIALKEFLWIDLMYGLKHDYKV